MSSSKILEDGRVLGEEDAVTPFQLGSHLINPVHVLCLKCPIKEKRMKAARCTQTMVAPTGVPIE